MQQGLSMFLCPAHIVSAVFFSIFGHVLGLYPIQIALGIIGAIAIAITAVVSLKMVGIQVSKN